MHLRKREFLALLRQVDGMPGGTIKLGDNACVPVIMLATGTPNGTKYLRDDGTWDNPPGGGTGQTFVERAKWDDF